MPVIIFIVVVFPAPLCPSKQLSDIYICERYILNRYFSLAPNTAKLFCANFALLFQSKNSEMIRASNFRIRALNVFKRVAVNLISSWPPIRRRNRKVEFLGNAVLEGHTASTYQINVANKKHANIIINITDPRVKISIN